MVGDAERLASVLRPACRAFRMLRPDWIKVVNGQRRPSSQAFQDRSESNAMSVYLEDDIVKDGRSPDELYTVFAGYSICFLSVADLQDRFKQEVLVQPVDLFPGHALVRDPNGKRTQATRSAMAREATWYTGSPV
jgi:hypothetical protein